MRDLGYAIGDALQVCLRKRSLWTIPLDAGAVTRKAHDD